MDLIHNSTFRILSGDLTGLYRIVFDTPELGKTIVMRLDPPDPEGLPETPASGTSQKKQEFRGSKKRGRPLVGAPLWLERKDLLDLADQHLLQEVEIVFSVHDFNW